MYYNWFDDRLTKKKNTSDDIPELDNWKDRKQKLKL